MALSKRGRTTLIASFRCSNRSGNDFQTWSNISTHKRGPRQDRYKRKLNLGYEATVWTALFATRTTAMAITTAMMAIIITSPTMMVMGGTILRA
jgi:hypothetical protein